MPADADALAVVFADSGGHPLWCCQMSSCATQSRSSGGPWVMQLHATAAAASRPRCWLLLCSACGDDLLAAFEEDDPHSFAAAYVTAVSLCRLSRCASCWWCCCCWCRCPVTLAPGRCVLRWSCPSRPPCSTGRQDQSPMVRIHRAGLQAAHSRMNTKSSNVLMLLQCKEGLERQFHTV